jgi:hypothetical protein
MAANWNNPTLTSLYVDFLAEIKARDVDVLTMAPGTNLPVGAKRWNPPTNTFQNWDGAAWNNLVLGAAGGGTGVPSGLPPLGTMASQNSNAVAITGGTITGVALDAGAINSGILALARGGTGASLALGPAGSFLANIGAAVGFTFQGGALIGLNASNVTVGNLPMAQMPVGGTWNLTGLVEIQQPQYIRMLSGGFIVGGIANMGSGTINAQAIYINGVPVASGAGIPSGLMAYFSGPCPAGWTFVAASGGRVVRSGNGGAGAGGGADDHNHGFSVPAGGGSGAYNRATGGANGDVSGGASNGINRSFDAGSSFSGWLPSVASHTHTIGHTHDVTIDGVPGFPGHSGGTDNASSWPPFIEFSLCSKN